VEAGLVEGLRLLTAQLAAAPAQPPQPALIPPGTEIIIKRGALASRIGLLAGPERVRLLLDIFGRQVEVTVARGDVEVLAPA
jgi:hypothetical protein